MKKFLAHIADDLPPADEVADADDLDFICDVLQDPVDFGPTMQERDDGSLAQLPADQQALWRALVHVQCVTHVMSDIAGDGLLSIFYNSSGKQVDHHRAALKASDPALSDLFEQAYALAAPALLIDPDSNFVTRNRGVAPRSRLSEEDLERLAELEQEIEEMWDGVFGRAIAAYKAAAPA